eukprot:404256-Hanusia_phi.AAC.4
MRGRTARGSAVAAHRLVRAGEEQEAVEEGYDRSDSSTGKEDEKEGVDQERRLPKHFSWRMISSIRWNLIENKFVEVTKANACYHASEALNRTWLSSWRAGRTAPF